MYTPHTWTSYFYFNGSVKSHSAYKYNIQYAHTIHVRAIYVFNGCKSIHIPYNTLKQVVNYKGKSSFTHVLLDNGQMLDLAYMLHQEMTLTNMA